MLFGYSGKTAISSRPSSLPMKRRSDSLEGALNVFVGITESDGAAVGAGGWVFGLCEGGEEPIDFFGIEGLVDFDGGVTGHGGGDAAAAGL